MAEDVGSGFSLPSFDKFSFKDVSSLEYTQPANDARSGRNPQFQGEVVIPDPSQPTSALNLPSLEDPVQPKHDENSNEDNYDSWCTPKSLTSQPPSLVDRNTAILTKKDEHDSSDKQSSNSHKGMHGHTHYVTDQPQVKAGSESYMNRLHAMSRVPLTMTGGDSLTSSLPDMPSLTGDNSITKVGPLTLNPRRDNPENGDGTVSSHEAQSSAGGVTTSSAANERAVGTSGNADEQRRSMARSDENLTLSIPSLKILTTDGSSAELGTLNAGKKIQDSNHRTPSLRNMQQPADLTSTASSRQPQAHYSAIGAFSAGTDSRPQYSTGLQQSQYGPVSSGLELYSSFSRTSMISQGKEEMIKRMSNADIVKMADSSSAMAWNECDKNPLFSQLHFEESLQLRCYLKPGCPESEKSLTKDFLGLSKAYHNDQDYTKALESLDAASCQPSISQDEQCEILDLKEKVLTAMGEVSKARECKKARERIVGVRHGNF